MCDAFSVRGKKLEPGRACTLFVCTCGERSKHFIEDNDLVLLCFELKFLKLWLNQKRLSLVVRALAVKGQCVLLRT